MKTKDKIIQAAIQLFNNQGVIQVSLRRIAAEVKISHSNLAYHYKSKNDIMLEIYRRMDEEMTNTVFPEGDLTLEHYHQLLKRISDFQQRHAFFYTERLAIAREHPEVIEHYRKTVTQRSTEYEGLINHLIKKGLVKPEEETGFYKSLFHSIWVMSTFWLQQKRILGEDHPLISSGSDIKHVWEILLPHLTAEGLWQYQLFIDEEVQNERPIQKKYLNQIIKNK